VAFPRGNIALKYEFPLAQALSLLVVLKSLSMRSFFKILITSAETT
jgi:hypothetical protein